MVELTSASLLVRIRDAGDREAWERFYARYTPLIISFCLDKGCTQEVALDVLQETLVCLMRVLPTFRYDPDRGQFRSFLLRIVESRIHDAFRRSRRAAELFCGNDTARAAEHVRDSRVVHPLDMWEKRWRQSLLVEALERVKLRVHPLTYRSFVLSVLEERPVADVARELAIQTNAVYQHRNRVLGLLRQEVEFLSKEQPG